MPPCQAWKLEFEASATVGFKLAFNYLKCSKHVEAIDICEKVLYRNTLKLIFQWIEHSLLILACLITIIFVLSCVVVLCCGQVLGQYPDYPRIREEILVKAQNNLRP